MVSLTPGRRIETPAQLVPGSSYARGAVLRLMTVILGASPFTKRTSLLQKARAALRRMPAVEANFTFALQRTLPVTMLDAAAALTHFSFL